MQRISTALAAMAAAFGVSGDAIVGLGNAADAVPDFTPLRDKPKRGKGKGHRGRTIESLHRDIRRKRRQKAFKHPIKFAPNQPLS